MEPLRPWILPHVGPPRQIQMKRRLNSLNGRVQTSTGELRQSTHDRREYVKTVVDYAERFRAQVVAIHGAKGPELVDYGLATRKERRAGPAPPGEGPDVRKAERKLVNAQARFIRAQGEFERVQARLSRAEALLAQREKGWANVLMLDPSKTSLPTDAPPSSETE